MKRKFLAYFILAGISSSMLFSGCSNKTSVPSNNAVNQQTGEVVISTSESSVADQSISNSVPEVTNNQESETFRTEDILVSVPNGWKAFNSYEIDYDDGKTEREIDEDTIYVYKNANTEMDMFSKPGMTITVSDYNADSRGFYDTVEDISPIKIGNRTWEGFNASTDLSGGEGTDIWYYTILSCQELDDYINVLMVTENEGEKISVEDSDVLQILESIMID